MQLSMAEVPPAASEAERVARQRRVLSLRSLRRQRGVGGGGGAAEAEEDGEASAASQMAAAPVLFSLYDKVTAAQAPRVSGLPAWLSQGAAAVAAAATTTEVAAAAAAAAAAAEAAAACCRTW